MLWMCRHFTDHSEMLEGNYVPTLINKMKFKVKVVKDGHPVALYGIHDDAMDEDDKTLVHFRVFLLCYPYTHFLYLLASGVMTG